MGVITALNSPKPPPGGPGRVALEGAGPGDPDLLTVKAARLIGAADVVFYDRLVGPGVLALIRSGARRVYVGKVKGAHAVPQGDIQDRLIAAARTGAFVVRLKGGDPSLFARGGEELDALAAAGVPVDIVPGITAAQASAAAAGFSLTHRDCAQAVSFVTGHARTGAAPDLDWAALARPNHTLVVYMGVSTAGEIAAALIAAGRAPDTPVAVVENASRADERVLTTALNGLAELVGCAAIDGPALLIIGEPAAKARSKAAAQIVTGASAPRLKEVAA
ncbi:MAG: uroporphyrinogen-III C-methyltransferase [Maricaulaceae bacterium]